MGTLDDGSLIHSLAGDCCSAAHTRAFAPVRIPRDQVLSCPELDGAGSDLQQVSRARLCVSTWKSPLTRSTLSYPLLIIISLGHLSNDDSALGLLKWRVLDGISGVVDRATVYIVINWALTQVAR